MATTASPAAARESKLAVAATRALGAATSRNVASVTTASVPSEPTRSWASRRPVAFFRVAAPVRNTRPFAVTASSASTYSAVTPYLKQRGPPAFVAMFPPIVERSSAAGSGG